FWPFLAVSTAMWGLSALAALRSARAAPLSSMAPWWCRPLVSLLHLCQPIVRAWHRYAHRLSNKSVRSCTVHKAALKAQVKKISLGRRDLYWTSNEALGRERLLEMVLAKARLAKWT